MQGSLSLSQTARCAMSAQGRLALTRSVRLAPRRAGLRMQLAMAAPSSSSLATLRSGTGSMLLGVSHRASFSTSRTNREEESEESKELDSGEQNIHDILTREFQPAHLQVQDVSGEWARTVILLECKTLTASYRGPRRLWLLLRHHHCLVQVQREIHSECSPTRQRGFEGCHCRHSRPSGE